MEGFMESCVFQVLRLLRERRVLLQLQLHQLLQQPASRASAPEVHQAMSRQKSERFQAKGEGPLLTFWVLFFKGCPTCGAKPGSSIFHLFSTAAPQGPAYISICGRFHSRKLCPGGVNVKINIFGKNGDSNTLFS
jgi:hypothetical protein